MHADMPCNTHTQLFTGEEHPVNVIVVLVLTLTQRIKRLLRPTVQLLRN